YIRHDEPIDQPARAVRRELLEPPEQWLPASVTSPLGDRRFLVRVGFHAAAARISKQVELTVGMPEAQGDWLGVPVAWRATGPDPAVAGPGGRVAGPAGGPAPGEVWVGPHVPAPGGGLGARAERPANAPGPPPHDPGLRQGRRRPPGRAGRRPPRLSRPSRL